MPILSAAHLHTGTEMYSPGFVQIEEGRVVVAGAGLPGGGARHHDGFLLPGFVDLHCHGGGGASFLSGDAAEIQRAAAFHRRHGTTTLLASLPSAPLPEMLDAVRAVASLCERTGRHGTLIGLHSEGPFLSHARCGAHAPQCLLAPEMASLERLLDPGAVRVMTIAPELEGAAALQRRLAESGVVVALGHSDADHATAAAAIAAGAGLITHLFNAMRPLHHREPGLAGAALSSDVAVCELIADGMHVHDAMLRTAFAALGAHRVALVTDALPMTGTEARSARLGATAVEVRGGRATVAGGDVLAGSLLTMDAALRRAVAAGVSLDDAVRAATDTPARLLGLAGEAGSLVPGARADLLLLDRELSLLEVVTAESW